MVNNHLKTSLRHLRRQERYGLLNMAGLTVGLAAVLVLAIYIRGQLSYDEFHEQAPDIYRVTYEVIDGDQRNHYATAVPALGPALSNDFTGIEHSVRVSRPEVYVSSGREWHREDEFLFVDSTFFQVFGFELVRGSASSVLARPNTVVLTQKMAAKYFGDNNPIGRTLQLDFRGERELQVTGIVRNPRRNSHLRFEFLASYRTFTSILPWFDAGNWLLRGSYTYVRLRSGTDAANLTAQLPAFINRHMAQADVPGNHEFRLHLQPITNIHLHSDLRGELASNGNVMYVYILGAVAILILLISGFNYVNLSTSQALDRRKEVGVRTAVGAGRTRLMAQFLGESVLYVALCGLAGVGLAWLTMPFTDPLVGSGSSLQLPDTMGFWTLYAGVVLVVGVLAGAYPALYLSSLRPVDVLGPETSGDVAGLSLRKTLVVAEFALAIILLAGTTVAYQQMTYVRDADLGFQKDQVLILPFENTLQERYRPETVKRELEQVSGVSRVSISSHVPTMGTPMNYQIRPVDGRQNRAVPITAYRVDTDFLPALGIDLSTGRNFSRKIASDSSNFIINRAAAGFFGWHEPVGRVLERPNPDGPNARGRIVGVIDDLHFRSLHHSIEPLVLELSSEANRFIVVRSDRPDISPIAAALETKWNQLAADRPFSYTVLSDHYEALYRQEARLADMVTVFTVLAVFIACLGLFGLVAYSTQRRTKEIGIRKVLGATVPGVTVLLVKDFLTLVGIGFVFAVPIAYLGAHRWLQNFAYRIELGPAVFAAAGFIAFVIAVLTVGYRSIQAATTNPAESIRYE